jgi:hypothetical protein
MTSYTLGGREAPVGECCAAGHLDPLSNQKEGA